MMSDSSLGIAMLVAFIIFCFTTAIVSTVRRNRRTRSYSRDDPINPWSSSGEHGHGHHGGGWGGGGDSGGHHGGGWGGGGDGGSVGGHHG
jgi:hypothetical protein